MEQFAGLLIGVGLFVIILCIGSLLFNCWFDKHIKTVIAMRKNRK